MLDITFEIIVYGYMTGLFGFVIGTLVERQRQYRRDELMERED